MGHHAAILLPLYVVIDVSGAMVDEGRLDAAGVIVPAVTDAIARNPALADRVRVGLIDFASSATVRLPLCDLRGQQLASPELVARDGISYSAAFTVLRQTIETDIAKLKADGYLVHRPVVWFVCGAEPQEDPSEWQAAFERLTAGRMYPYVIPCGVGTARADLLASLVHPAVGPRRMTLYLAEPASQPAQAVTGMAELIISSMIQSGYGLGHASAGVILPEAQDLPAGVTRFEPHDFV